VFYLFPSMPPLPPTSPLFPYTTLFRSINCAICYAACDTVRWNSDYLGPAALNRAWALVNDERDAGNPERLRSVAASGGCHACHSHQSCQELCPQRLNPTASIAGLKRRTMWAYVKGEL